MKRVTVLDAALILLAVCLLVVLASHHRLVPADSGAVRFESVDVYLDSGTQDLAAYQVEITLAKGQGEIVGLEGGEHPAFANPPYYDPAALMGKRIIVAALSTDHALPQGKTRIARLHMQIAGATTAEYAVTLIEALGPQGQKISAQATTR